MDFWSAGGAVLGAAREVETLDELTTSLLD